MTILLILCLSVTAVIIIAAVYAAVTAAAVVCMLGIQRLAGTGRKGRQP